MKKSQNNEHELSKSLIIKLIPNFIDSNDSLIINIFVLLTLLSYSTVIETTNKKKLYLPYLSQTTATLLLCRIIKKNNLPLRKHSPDNGLLA